MKAEIKGAYSSKKSGEELIDKNGQPYYKLLLVTDDEQAVYPAFFLNAKSYWVTENAFKSAGMEPPPIDIIEMAHFQSLVGKTVNVSIGENQAGYLSVLKWFPALQPAETSVVDVAEPIDDIAGQSADDPTDPDLDEDVPF